MSHFFTLFVCKETFNRILTKIIHTINFHLQQLIYTDFLLFFSVEFCEGDRLLFFYLEKFLYIAFCVAHHRMKNILRRSVVSFRMARLARLERRPSLAYKRNAGWQSIPTNKAKPRLLAGFFNK
ncbi:hypothetical protein CSN27_001596 [Salmonella enterica subsp. houtenae]|nr:hypothetical protein [Salmonella enterica subsp. houtenae]